MSTMERSAYFQKRLDYWLRTLPMEVAMAQTWWEFKASLSAARTAGLKGRELAKSLRLTSPQIYNHVKSITGTRTRMSPVEKYLQDPIVDLKAWVLGIKLDHDDETVVEITLGERPFRYFPRTQAVWRWSFQKCRWEPMTQQARKSALTQLYKMGVVA